jgi:murein DD-endopeptidase MepM/ murein hydrolase activator NlpD
MRSISIAGLALCGLLLGGGEIQAQGRRGAMASPQGDVETQSGDEALSPDLLAAFSPMRSTLEGMKAKGFLATGLVPQYPLEAACPAANSFFADPTRGDGSRRSPRFYQGLHGGLDIPVPVGTQVLAIADGTLVRKEEGANIGGFAIVLQHAPSDTGLPVWTYTEYKHLHELPGLEIGQRVRKGDAIAQAGLSGTTGGHYGPLGHSHLHVSAWFSPVPGYRNRRFFIPDEGQWMDPLALFRGPPVESRQILAQPDGMKRVALPYKTMDGRMVPEGSRTVWPLLCKGK